MSHSELQYYEIVPAAPLSEYVRCVWRLSAPSGGLGPSPAPIVPDGCVELVLNLGDPFIRHTSGAAPYHQPLALVAGQISRAITIAPAGRIDLWGIRFHPWSAAAFLGTSGDELRDSIF